MLVLEELWYGLLSPCEETRYQFQEQQELILLLEQNEKRLIETLDQEQHKVLDNMKSLVEELQIRSDLSAFQSGFSLAIRIMTEAMGNYPGK